MANMQQASYTLQSPNSPELTTKPESRDLNTVMGYIVLMLPIAFLLGVATYRKHRAVTLRRQVKTLDKLWLLNSIEKLS